MAQPAPGRPPLAALFSGPMFASLKHPQFRLLLGECGRFSA
ncbi:MAG TPA: hypothetical protein VMR52_04760 [Dehalococcoidia bacterium]|nr:hypothetical protein [Dehalococcoidia bacterium]